MSVEWKPGRGRLGALDPLLGAWVAEGRAANGAYRCERRFDRVLEGRYVQLIAIWDLPGRRYEELALFGVDPEQELRMWSFTSDGRQATGELVDPWDLPRPNLSFQAEMPAGLARFAYWPDKQAGGVRFVVESKVKRGWNRFLEHLYLPVAT